MPRIPPARCKYVQRYERRGDLVQPLLEPRKKLKRIIYQYNEHLVILI